MDVKTAWIIAGHGHGHDESKSNATNSLSAKMVKTYLEITPKNMGTFHFHSDTTALPLTAILVEPMDAKGTAMVLGRYQHSGQLQALKPPVVVNEMMGMVMRVRQFLDANYALVASAMGMLLALIVALSRRLRSREMETLFFAGLQSRHAVCFAGSGTTNYFCRCARPRHLRRVGHGGMGTELLEHTCRMKQLLILISIFVIGCKPTADAPAPRTGKPRVAVVNYPLAYFVERIAGDLVEAHFPTMEGDPAFWKPTSAEVRKFQSGRSDSAQWRFVREMAGVVITAGFADGEHQRGVSRCVHCSESRYGTSARQGW